MGDLQQQTECAETNLTELAPGFFFIDTLDRGVRGYVGGWLVEGERGVVIVDPGAGASVPLWLSALKEAEIGPERVEWILLTHIHLDHAGAAGGLLEHLPNARIGVHPAGIKHLLNPERLMTQARLAWGEDFDLLGEMLPAPTDRIVGLNDGEMLSLDTDPCFRVLYTPGHTPHHIAYLEETTGGIFSGDALGAFFGGMHPFGEFMPIPGISPPVGDIPQYLKSIRKIADFRPRRIYASHYGLWEPASLFIDLAIKQIGEIWELCREVHDGGGTLSQLQQQWWEQLMPQRLSLRGQVELEKNFNSMLAAVWNYVATPY